MESNEGVCVWGAGTGTGTPAPKGKHNLAPHVGLVYGNLNYFFSPVCNWAISAVSHLIQQLLLGLAVYLYVEEGRERRFSQTNVLVRKGTA